MKQQEFQMFEGELEFLSNFSPSEIMMSWGNETFQAPTVEHAFQASKALDFEDFLRIIEAETPGKAKRLGRKIQIRSDWVEVKLDIMFGLLLDKFKIPELAGKLRQTEGPLVEWNIWHDTFWGQCICNRCPAGENRLGKMLVSVRELL